MIKAKAGTGRVTPQKVRAVLRKVGLRPSRVEKARDWVVAWPEYNWDANGMMMVDDVKSLPAIAAALAAAGIACEVRDGAVWVPVEKP